EWGVYHSVDGERPARQDVDQVLPIHGVLVPPIENRIGAKAGFESEAGPVRCPSLSTPIRAVGIGPPAIRDALAQTRRERIAAQGQHSCVTEPSKHGSALDRCLGNGW